MRLYTKDLVKRYKARTVVDHVSIEVNQGEIVGLLGPNGAGKTTTFYMIVGLIKPNEGQIFLEDQEITKEPVYKRAQKGVGYLAQEASVFRRLSVELSERLSGRAARKPDRGVPPDQSPQEPRHPAFGRRAPTDRNRARRSHQSEIHPARRAVRRRRPDRRRGHPEHRGHAQEQEHRRDYHRP